MNSGCKPAGLKRHRCPLEHLRRWGYTEMDHFEITNKRIELTPGKYKAVLNNTAKEFIIRNEMITEVEFKQRQTP